MPNSNKTVIPGSKSNLSPIRSQPPKRGQVKIRIIKSLFKGLASMAGGLARKPKENGGFLSSSSQTPAETPSGYCSDAQSQHSGLLKELKPRVGIVQMLSPNTPDCSKS